jgi:uncharacterized protein (TIGR02996 family)
MSMSKPVDPYFQHLGCEPFLQAIAEEPNEHRYRLIFADWLEERGHSGADYLRTEVALAGAAGDEAVRLRRKLLEIIPRLPTAWRDRFEQPDLLLAPPMPFATGWYSANAVAPQPYRSLPNLDPACLSPEMSWLSGEGVEERADQAQHELEELAALAEVKQRATRRKLTLPPGFEALARDFPRRNAICRSNSHFFEVLLHDAIIYDNFPKVGEGYLISFFGDMYYGNPHQLAWSLYLLPEIDWHCVVVFELGFDADYLFPDDPALIYYCAPSFQAFLYRWWLGPAAWSK